MSNPISITDLPAQDMVDDKLFHDGDMALVLSPNGGLRTVAFGIDTDRLNDTPREDLTDDEVETLSRGHMLFALMIAAQSPMLMNILLEVANNPDVVDLKELIKKVSPH